MASQVDLARQFLGRDETRDRQVLQDFFQKSTGSALDPATTAWCARFLRGVLGQSGYDVSMATDMARSFLNFGQDVQAPQQGDVVVFWRGSPEGELGHVGLFMGFDSAGNIQVLGGNQGNQVSIKSYPADQVLGYRRPTPDAKAAAVQVARTNTQAPTTGAGAGMPAITPPARTTGAAPAVDATGGSSPAGALPGGSRGPNNAETLQEGATGPAVKAWQSYLQAAGINTPVNGVFDYRTAAATRMFQRKAGIPVTGVADMDTRKVTADSIAGARGGNIGDAIRGWFEARQRGERPLLDRLKANAPDPKTGGVNTVQTIPITRPGAGTGYDQSYLRAFNTPPAPSPVTAPPSAPPMVAPAASPPPAAAVNRGTSTIVAPPFVSPAEAMPANDAVMAPMGIADLPTAVAGPVAPVPGLPVGTAATGLPGAIAAGGVPEAATAAARIMQGLPLTATAAPLPGSAMAGQGGQHPTATAATSALPRAVASALPGGLPVAAAIPSALPATPGQPARPVTAQATPTPPTAAAAMPSAVAQAGRPDGIPQVAGGIEPPMATPGSTSVASIPQPGVGLTQQLASRFGIMPDPYRFGAAPNLSADAVDQTIGRYRNIIGSNVENPVLPMSETAPFQQSPPLFFPQGQTAGELGTRAQGQPQLEPGGAITIPPKPDIPLAGIWSPPSDGTLAGILGETGNQQSIPPELMALIERILRQQHMARVA